jgi:hypothetical protein
MSAFEQADERPAPSDRPTLTPAEAARLRERGESVNPSLIDWSGYSQPDPRQVADFRIGGWRASRFDAVTGESFAMADQGTPLVNDRALDNSDAAVRYGVARDGIVKGLGLNLMEARLFGLLFGAGSVYSLDGEPLDDGAPPLHRALGLTRRAAARLRETVLLKLRDASDARVETEFPPSSRSTAQYHRGNWHYSGLPERFLETIWKARKKLYSATYQSVSARTTDISPAVRSVSRGAMTVEPIAGIYGRLAVEQERQNLLASRAAELRASYQAAAELCRVSVPAARKRMLDSHQDLVRQRTKVDALENAFTARCREEISPSVLPCMASVEEAVLQLSAAVAELRCAVIDRGFPAGAPLAYLFQKHGGHGSIAQGRVLAAVDALQVDSLNFKKEEARKWSSK